MKFNLVIIKYQYIMFNKSLKDQMYREFLSITSRKSKSFYFAESSRVVYSQRETKRLLYL